MGNQIYKLSIQESLLRKTSNKKREKKLQMVTDYVFFFCETEIGEKGVNYAFAFMRNLRALNSKFK